MQNTKSHHLTLIADSGSTKTTWSLIDKNAQQKTVSEAAFPVQDILATSLGINPVRDNEETIRKAISSGWAALVEQCLANADATETGNTKEKSDKTDSPMQEQIGEIFFYGAGCIPPYSTTVKRMLQLAYPNAKVHVESDMLGAALALCGHHEGIACILGTGSNSCLFDGTRITQQTPALGFILGDEGSGASLGKRLVGDILKHQLPKHLEEAFLDETGLQQPDIINRVYRQPQPNMFLASLTPFLARHLSEPSIEQLVVDEFRRFLQRNIRNYQRPDLAINFVGGITATFGKELQKAIEMEGMKMGSILARPISGMVAYHQS